MDEIILDLDDIDFLTNVLNRNTETSIVVIEPERYRQFFFNCIARYAVNKYKQSLAEEKKD